MTQILKYFCIQVIASRNIGLIKKLNISDIQCPKDKKSLIFGTSDAENIGSPNIEFMSSKIYLAISRQKRKSPNYYIIGIDEVGRAASKRRTSRLARRKSKRAPKSYLIGIDEVGRGPLAGPVTVAAVALPSGIPSRISHFPHLTSHISLPLLKDSKKLTPKQREEWFNWIKNNSAICYAVVNVSPKIIDKINISNAANLAATKAVLKLLTNDLRPITYNRIKILLDGGLYINSKFKNQKSKSQFKIKNFKIQTIIRGDELVPIISLASIVAKVHRDKLMEKFHKKYPLYGFNKHKGYGTKLHIIKIKKYGISKIHRKSFLKNIRVS